MPTYLTDSRENLTYEWNGSYIVNVWKDGVEIDCYTFGFNAEGTPPTYIEFIATVNRRKGS